MTPNLLSPAAQAVLAAPTRAAAIVALLDHVVPVFQTGGGFRMHRSAVAARTEVRRQILAIATELEGQANG